MYHTHKEMGIRDIWFFFSLATVEIAKQWSNTFNILWENDYKIKILYSAISQVCVMAEGRDCWTCQNLKILPPLELLSGKGWRWRESESCSVVSDSLWPPGPYSPWNSPDQNSGMGSLSFLQGILPTQGSNPSLLHCSWILHQLSHKGNPSILEQVAYPFSTGSSRPRNQTRVSGMAGRFFYQLSWAIRERSGKRWYACKILGLPRQGNRSTTRGSPRVRAALLPSLSRLSAVSDSCDPIYCTGSSAHGILQARILEWVAISFSRGSSWSRNWTCVSGIAGKFFTNWAMKEDPLLTYGALEGCLQEGKGTDRKFNDNRYIITIIIYIMHLLSSNINRYWTSDGIIKIHNRFMYNWVHE